VVLYGGDGTDCASWIQISEAYQVLSDPEMRARYDERGKAGTEPEGGFANPREFFQAMFGGGRFDKYIGNLAMATEIEEQSDMEKSRLRRQRVFDLALHLKERLQHYEVLGPTKFQQQARAEAMSLANESFGRQLLDALGYIYTQKAKQFLGSSSFFGIVGLLHSAHEQVHLVREKVSLVSVAIELDKTAKEIEREELAERDGQMVDEQRKAARKQEAGERVMEALWRFNKLDVEYVLREVCTVVVEDVSVPKEKRLQRAEALKVLGQEFSAVASEFKMAQEATLTAQRMAAGPNSTASGTGPTSTTSTSTTTGASS
jgi:hypothetical protein